MSTLIKVAGSRSAWHQAVTAAVSSLQRGGVIALPTETLYGLSACFDDGTALARIYDLKKRPTSKAMPIIIGDQTQLNLLAQPMSDMAQRLITHFWPGPLTLLLPAQAHLSSFLVAGGAVAVRMPGPSCALEVVGAMGKPLVATSANMSGYAPAITAEQVLAYFPVGLDLIIDAGQSPLTVGSTIVDVRTPHVRIVREGAIAAQEIERIVGRV